MKKRTPLLVILTLIFVLLTAAKCDKSIDTSPASTVQEQITTTFGFYGQAALNVARCESGFNPSAYNTTPVWLNGIPYHAMGVFQIIPPTFSRVSSGNVYNASDNIEAAYQIFTGDGYSWREWECKPW